VAVTARTANAVTASAAPAIAAACGLLMSMAEQKPVLAVQVGDRLVLAKPHPCGSREWQVTRIGADIGLICAGCSHKVMLERRDLERRFRGFVQTQ
jgi:hypothetical protein